MASKLISDTAGELIPQGPNRKSFIVQNEDGAIACFIKKERPGATIVSTTDHDHRVGPGAFLTLNFGTDGEEAIKERWTIVAASGTPRISIFETEEIKR